MQCYDVSGPTKCFRPALVPAQCQSKLFQSGTSARLKQKSRKALLQMPPSPSIFPKKMHKVALLHILKFVTQNVSFLMIDIIFTKTIFDIMFMLNFTHFLLNTFLRKKNILSCISGFTQIRVFRVMLSIRRMMKHIHQINFLPAITLEWLTTRDS